jgi:hypothetical protein
MHHVSVTTRPVLDARLSGAELRRWYWLHRELLSLAKTLGVSPSGSKLELTDRLATALDGQPAPELTRRVRRSQLRGPLTEATAIPPGQSCSEPLRAFFVDRIGPGFRFDAAMRDFIAGAAGRSLGEAVDHWWATRAAPTPTIGPQFELNRFTRAWHLAHPRASRAELLAAWRIHRGLPAESRLATDSQAA